MREVVFHKMSGAGNDFIIFDGLANAAGKGPGWASKQSRPELVRSICRRGLSVGADGVVFLEPSTTSDFSWDFYNSDGSSAEMCGNAARCVASLAYQLGHADRNMKFETLAGVVAAQVHPDHSVTVELPEANLLLQEREILVEEEKRKGMFVISGVPHFVLIQSDIRKTEELKRLAKTLRWHPSFQPKGTNVTFVSHVSERSLCSITFERGVEDFTLACGTGAIAAALSYSSWSGVSLAKEIAVVVPGGELWVSLNEINGRARLRGPAQSVFVGHLNGGML